MVPTVGRITTPTPPSTIVLSLKRYINNRMSDNMADDQIAPHLTGLINGVGWQSGFPRTMTQRDIDGLLASSDGDIRLAAIQDVSCDLKVSLTPKLG
jgi:beta-lactamase class A